MSTNLTVRDVVRFHVCRCGDMIHSLKQGNAKPGTKSPHISPMSDDWEIYKGYKRECSMWLTAIKVHKRHPDFSTAPIDRETKDDYESKLCHLSKAQRGNATRYFVEAERRLMKIRDQLEHRGSRKTTTRYTFVIDPKSKTAKGRVEHDITYTDKSFEHIAQWKEAYEQAMIANRKAQAEGAEKQEATVRA